MTKINFDVEKVLSELPEDERGFEPLPDGWYEAQVNASSIKTTKAGNGEYLELEFDIIGDDYKGLVVQGAICYINTQHACSHLKRTRCKRVLFKSTRAKRVYF